jgi:hypothetical protein
LFYIHFPTFGNKNRVRFPLDFSFVDLTIKVNSMRNNILVGIFLFFGTGMFAQEGFKIGFQGGLPINEYNDVLGVVIGVDAGYMWALGEVVDLGVAVGFVNGFPEKFRKDTSVDLPNIQFVPLAASVRVWPSNSFSFGLDAGQAIGLNEGNDGGLYYRPIIGYLMGAATEVNLSYTGIRIEGQPWATVTLGVLVTL